jgi:hypothetical protein
MKAKNKTILGYIYLLMGVYLFFLLNYELAGFIMQVMALSMFTSALLDGKTK